MYPAADSIAVFRNLFHSLKDVSALFRRCDLIDGRIQHPFFFEVVGAEQFQQRQLFMIALLILFDYFLMNGLQLLADLAMFVSHDEGRSTFGHAGFLLP